MVTAADEGLVLVGLALGFFCVGLDFGGGVMFDLEGEGDLGGEGVVAVDLDRGRERRRERERKRLSVVLVGD
jgi:hypothetical protein